MFLTSVQPSLYDLLQTYTWFLDEGISSPNSALSLVRISPGFTF